MLKICIYIGINAHVTPVDGQRRNVKIELEFWNRIRNNVQPSSHINDMWYVLMWPFVYNFYQFVFMECH